MKQFLNKHNFRVHRRFKAFWHSLTAPDFINVRFIINVTGWLFTFFLLFLSIENNYSWKFLYLIAHGYFWIVLNRDIIKKLKPPAEVLLLLILFFMSLEFNLLNSVFPAAADSTALDVSVWGITDFMHKFFLGILFLLFGLVLVECENRRQYRLIIYILFGLIAHEIVFFEHRIYLYIFQFILFFSLLKRTTWLEKLTRIELYIYFALILWIFLVVKEPAAFQRIHGLSLEDAGKWYSIPFYLYLLFKLYFLALLIKIPVIVIYNHAGLSRKLWISGLFQSTFPQLIQLVVLLFIFYFFVAGWQANNLLTQVAEAFEETGRERTTFSSTQYQIKNDSTRVVHPDGYREFHFSDMHPDKGIVALTRDEGSQVDYFSFKGFGINGSRYVRFVKLDSLYLQQLLSNLSAMAATGLIAYPYEPNLWQSFLHRIDLLQSEDDIRINPFAMLNPFTVDYPVNLWRTEAMRPGGAATKSLNISFGPVRIDNARIVVGRVYMPVVNGNSGNPYLAIDIVYNLAALFQWGFMLKTILGLIVLYFLFNIFVIRRVGKFGSEINRMIVQKFAQLKSAIKQISSGNLDYRVQMEGEDEFVELGEHFNQMAVRLKESLEEVKEKERLDQELKIAREVQLSLLPEEIPELPGFKIVATVNTATEVGGDFYDIIPLDKDKALFAIGDVSGKGASAAFYMAQFISLLRYSPKFTSDPLQIAARLNEYVYTQVADKQIFITMILGMLEANKNTIRYVRAGHSYPVYIPKDLRKKPKTLPSVGLGVGLAKTVRLFNKSVKSKEVNLNPNDKLLFYTDGIVEAARAINTADGGERTEFYGEERLFSLLENHQSLAAQDLLDKIVDDLHAFYNGRPRIDDYTILIIEKTPE